MARRKGDPLAKRADETDLQWRSRVARIQETRRVQGEDIVTPERLAKGDLTAVGKKSGQVQSYRIRSTSSLERLEMRGVISKEQLAAAQVLAKVIEYLGSEVGYASGNMDRVDCGGRNNGGESEGWIKTQQAYNAWRATLPAPKGMVIDMIRKDNKLAAIASEHGRSWRKAIVVLKTALDEWPRIRAATERDLTDADIAAAIRGAGCA